MLQVLRLETCFTDASNYWPKICSIEPTRRTSLGCSPRRLRMVKPIVETKTAPARFSNEAFSGANSRRDRTFLSVHRQRYAFPEGA